MCLSKKLEERNKRLDRLFELCEENEITYEDLSAILCAGMINHKCDDMKTRVMVQGNIYTVKIEKE